jgi:SSS family solute:Na+ symporter
MPTQFSNLDWLILVGYFISTMGVGVYFYWRGHSVEGFTAANRSLPGWAVGLSMFGSYVSSISFLANPGAAYDGNWNAFVFSLAMPIAAAIAVHWFVPFYRRSGQVSAYEHLEYRFGAWARTYAVASFLLLQMARMGTVVYLLSLVMAPITGYDIKSIIIVTGSAMTLYTFLGGIGAVVWTGVLQSAILVTGVVICLVSVVYHAPGGVGTILSDGFDQGKLSLGDWGFSLVSPTFWVVFVYGLFINVGNFAVDQSYVQRYITARSDRDAAKSVWLTASLYVPVAAIFFFIGTGLYLFYNSQPGSLPLTKKPDEVFPYFISTQLPLGLAGIVIAAIFAASMDSNLNSMATLTYCDLYKRYLRPHATEREGLLVLRSATLFWGGACVVVGLAMIRAKSALDAWWQLAGVFSGGVLGLFLLGMLCPRAKKWAGISGVAVGVAVIAWMVISPTYWGRVTKAAKISGESLSSVHLEKGASQRVASGAVIHLTYASIDPQTSRPTSSKEIRKVVAVNDRNVVELDEPLRQQPTGDITIFSDSTWYRWRNPLHPYLTAVAGTCTVLIAGFVVSLFGSRRSSDPTTT